MSEPTRPVRVTTVQWEATDVYSFVLRGVDGSPLPGFDAGSHIDVQLPNGMMRSYSLSAPARSDSYRITVARDPASTGGSAYLAEQLRPGAILRISDPRNNFPLAEGGKLSVFIAGGIGVTPFVPMMARLNALGRSWRIHYTVRTRDRAALLREIEILAAQGFGEVQLNCDQEPGGVMLDLPTLIARYGNNAHFYCCGPSGMLDAFREACDAAGIQDEQIHFEYFKSNVVVDAAGGFELILARTKKTIKVMEGQTILEALLAAGLSVPFSCEEGVCGACETRVLAGEIEHRDLILSDSERAANNVMMVCCSGARSASLTLDV